MKITSYLARFAAGAFAAFALGVTVGHGALVFFSMATAAIVLMSAVGDYSPRRSASYAAIVAARRTREPMPLAA